jgi:3-phosphoshikimate 1-carboxyvinyltransferase
MPMATWSAPHCPGPLDAVCAVPGSKSESNRALVMAALADGPSELTGLLSARDTDLMVAALRHLGVRIEHHESSAVTTVSPPDRFRAAPGGIDCGLAGTVMRFIPPLAALAGGPTRFYGDQRAGERPMAPLLSGLRQLGVRVDADNLPFTIDAPAELGGPRVVIDASASSQFISGLLLMGARLPHGLDLHHQGTSVPSLPHIQMTVSMLGARGVKIDDSQPGRWLVAAGPIMARNERIEPDLSNAAAFLAAGVLSGGQVQVPGWPLMTTQPGDLIRHVLEQLGAGITRDADALQATATGALRGTTIDLHAASELTPVVAALAAFAEGTTTISGVAHIRGHETDRLAAIEAELASLGVDVRQTADGVVIEGAGPTGAGLQPTRVLRSYADHRMAHMAALLGLVVPGVQLDDVDTVAKTMPDFTARWQAMLAQPRPDGARP